MKTTSVKSRLVSRLVLDGLARSSFFLLTLYLARRLGTASFGVLAYALSLAQIFYVFTDLGLLLQMMANAGELETGIRTRWISFYRIKLYLIGFTFLGGSLVGWFLWKSTYPYWIFISGLLWMSGNSIFDFQQAVCNTVGDMKAARRILLFQRGIFLIVLAPVIWFFPSLKVAVLTLAIMSVLSSLISHVILINDLGGTFSGPRISWKPILRASFPNAVGSAFYLWGLRASVILLAWESSQVEVGIYAASVRVFEMSYILPAAIMAIGLPHLSMAWLGGSKVFWQRWRRYAALLLSIGVCWAAGFLFFSGWIVRVLFGSAYLAAVGPIRVFGMAGGLVIFNQLFNQTMVVIGKQGRLANTCVVVFVVCVLLCIILIPSMHAIGAAVAVLFEEVVLFIFSSVYLLVHRREVLVADRPIPFVES